MLESVILPVLIAVVVGLLATALRVLWSRAEVIADKNYANAAKIEVLEEKIKNVADDVERLAPKM